MGPRRDSGRVPVRRPDSVNPSTSSTLTRAAAVVQCPWIRMLPRASGQPVLLRERRCQSSGCQKAFYLCKSCDRGQRYCSPDCAALSRRLQHRRASARYQQTPEGRQTHRDCQNAYREQQRARSAMAPVVPVTDLSSNFSDSGSSCLSDDARPTPHSHIPPTPRTPPPHPRSTVPSGFRCLVCGRPGYLQKRDL